MEASPNTRPADRRRAPRTPTTLRAKVFPGGWDCVVNDFSRGGARLRFAGEAPADDRIVLVLWSTGIAFEAVRCWRDGAEAGWRFLGRFDLRQTVPARLAEVKAQWRDRRHKLRRNELRDSGVMLGYRGSPRSVRLS